MATIEKSHAGAKAEEQKNRLGISKSVYAIGYSFKDALVWGLAATATVWGVITFGAKRFPVIGTFEKKLIQGHDWWKALTGKHLKGGVVGVSIIAGWLVGHIAQIPSGALGWKKAQVAIDKHNKLHEEKDQLVEANTALKADNEKLKTALAEAEKNRPAMADRVRASARDAGASNSI